MNGPGATSAQHPLESDYRVLTYHGTPLVSDDFLSVSAQRLESHFEYLATIPYETQVLSELASTAGLDNGRPRIALTFDDGRLDNYDYAVPILERFGFKAVFYVIVGLIGNEFRGAPCMDATVLRELVSLGHEIGSHGLDHRVLTQLDARDLRNEVGGSKRKLEDLLSHGVRSFCYPEGRHNPRVTRAVQEAGYHSACCTLSGFNIPGPSYRIRRTELYSKDTSTHLRDKLAGKRDRLQNLYQCEFLRRSPLLTRTVHSLRLKRVVRAIR